MSSNGHADIHQSVNRLLGESELGKSYELHVVPDATREEDEWTYVVVAPSKPGIRAYEFADLLARIEEEVRKLIGTNEILLVPARMN